MKILWGILFGFVGIAFGLAAAFLSSDNSLVMNDALHMDDAIIVIKNGI